MNQTVSNSNTETVNGSTVTTTTNVTTSFTTDGTPGSSGGSWSIDAQVNASSTQTVTGTDPNGRDSTSTVTDSSDLTWDAWGSNGGPTHYHVVTDDTQDDSLSVKSGSYDEEVDKPSDSHLSAEGEVDPYGNLMSGDFTYSGHLGNTFSLTDGSGTPSGSSLGYSINYLSSEDLTLNDAGSLIPDSSNKGTTTVTETQNGQVADSDSLGNSASNSFGENAEVDDTYDNSLPIAGEADGPPPSQPTTISASGPKTPVPTGSGKNTV